MGKNRKLTVAQRSQIIGFLKVNITEKKSARLNKYFRK